MASWVNVTDEYPGDALLVEIERLRALSLAEMIQVAITDACTAAVYGQYLSYVDWEILSRAMLRSIQGYEGVLLDEGMHSAQTALGVLNKMSDALTTLIQRSKGVTCTEKRIPDVESITRAVLAALTDDHNRVIAHQRNAQGARFQIGIYPGLDHLYRHDKLRPVPSQVLDRMVANGYLEEIPRHVVPLRDRIAFKLTWAGIEFAQDVYE